MDEDSHVWVLINDRLYHFYYWNPETLAVDCFICYYDDVTDESVKKVFNYALVDTLDITDFVCQPLSDGEDLFTDLEDVLGEIDMSLPIRADGVVDIPQINKTIYAFEY